MRVLVVEDESELAGLVVAGFQKAGFTADGVGSLDEAHAALRGAPYDSIVLDLALPDGNGLALLRDIRAAKTTTPVLILTARDGVNDRVAGLDAGADDYLLKPFFMDELVARVRALLRRPGGLLSPILELANLAFHTGERCAFVQGQLISLTNREAMLLEMLLRRAGRVVLKRALEDGIYGFDDDVGSNAVEVNVHRLRKKLASAGATVQIHTLRSVGYLIALQPA